jgi:hypothetical protein
MFLSMLSTHTPVPLVAVNVDLPVTLTAGKLLFYILPEAGKLLYSDICPAYVG